MGLNSLGSGVITWPSEWAPITKTMEVSTSEIGRGTSEMAKVNISVSTVTCIRVSGKMTSSMATESKFGQARLNSKGILSVGSVQVREK
jgi:hypothetical protein